MSAIDLCQVPDVRSWLNINPTQDGAVATTATASIVAGIDQTITPLAMTGIGNGCVLLVGGELVVVKASNATTFTSDFNLAHAGPVTIIGQTNQILGRLITAMSATLMRKCGDLNADGTIPAQSTLVQQVAIDEWRDGSGNSRMFLRRRPVASVQSLSIDGRTIPESTSEASPGWVIDDTGTSIALRSYFCGSPMRQRAFTPYSVAINGFNRGIKNVHIQYTAGFSAILPDAADACIEMVALCYRRRNWIDHKQNTQPEGQGTIIYRDWEWPPKVMAFIEEFKRRWGG